MTLLVRTYAVSRQLVTLDGGAFFLALMKLASRGRFLATIDKATVFDGPNEIMSLIFDRRLRQAFGRAGRDVPLMDGNITTATRSHAANANGNTTRSRAQRVLQLRQNRRVAEKQKEHEKLKTWFRELPTAVMSPLMRLEVDIVPASLTATVAECRERDMLHPRTICFELADWKLECNLQYINPQRRGRDDKFAVAVSLEQSDVFLDVIFHVSVAAAPAAMRAGPVAASAACLPDLCRAFRQQLHSAHLANQEQHACAVSKSLLAGTASLENMKTRTGNGSNTLTRSHKARATRETAGDIVEEMHACCLSCCPSSTPSLSPTSSAMLPKETVRCYTSHNRETPGASIAPEPSAEASAARHAFAAYPTASADAGLQNACLLPAAKVATPMADILAATKVTVVRICTSAAENVAVSAVKLPPAMSATEELGIPSSILPGLRAIDQQTLRATSSASEGDVIKGGLAFAVDDTAEWITVAAGRRRQRTRGAGETDWKRLSLSVSKDTTQTLSDERPANTAATSATVATSRWSRGPMISGVACRRMGKVISDSQSWACQNRKSLSSEQPGKRATLLNANPRHVRVQDRTESQSAVSVEVSSWQQEINISGEPGSSTGSCKSCQPITPTATGQENEDLMAWALVSKPSLSPRPQFLAQKAVDLHLGTNEEEPACSRQISSSAEANTGNMVIGNLKTASLQLQTKASAVVVNLGVAKSSSNVFAGAKKSQGADKNVAVHLSQPIIAQEVRRQVNFYFSGENLSRDIYLVGLMDAYGSVPLDAIAEFPRMRSILQRIAATSTVRLEFAAACLRSDELSR